MGKWKRWKHMLRGRAASGFWKKCMMFDAVCVCLAAGAAFSSAGRRKEILQSFSGAAYGSGTEAGAQAEGEGLAGAQEEKKKVALTFDDGPNPEYTEPLLEGLKERGVHATFFLLGSQVELYPDIAKEIADGGHLIGTHSYDHVDLKNLSDADAARQVGRANEAIRAATGKTPQYIRPPFGSWKDDLDFETKMIEVLWDVDPLDWKVGDADTVVERALAEVGENDIILLHDASESSVEAAFQIIDALEREGYVFVTVDEILFD